MEKINTTITADLDMDMFESLQNKLNIKTEGYALGRKPLTPLKIIEKCKNTEILIFEYEFIDNDVINKLSKLKFICCCRGGFKTAIDINAANNKGILVSHAPGRNANAVADFNIGLLLNITRHITTSNNYIKNGEIQKLKGYVPTFYKDTLWGLGANSPFEKFKGISLNNKILGIIGFGNIGQILAKKSQIFGLRIFICDPYCDASLLKKHNVRRVCLERLLKESDFVSLCCSVTPETKQLINKDKLSIMKKSSFLINTSRGELINENDLIFALKKKKIAGAALDVFIEEPIKQDHPFLKLGNLMLTPHIAGSSEEIKKITTIMVINNLKDYLNGKLPRNAANSEIFITK